MFPFIVLTDTAEFILYSAVTFDTHQAPIEEGIIILIDPPTGIGLFTKNPKL